MINSPTVFTVGHSNRSLDEFTSLLTVNRIEALVDVRAQPHSTRFPHFCMDALRTAMERAGVVYHWAGRQLGGNRNTSHDSRHVALDGQLRGYADYMDSEPFRRAAVQLINMSGKSRLALLCAERQPGLCHRRLIADYLTLQGVQVIHLIDPGDTLDHQLSIEARRESADLVYDRNTNVQMEL